MAVRRAAARKESATDVIAARCCSRLTAWRVRRVLVDFLGGLRFRDAAVRGPEYFASWPKRFLQS